MKIQIKELISKAQARQNFLTQISTKINFANVIEKIPKPDKTNSPSTNKQIIQKPDECSEVTSETNSRISRNFQI